jgi:hypothetical protein
VQHDEKHEERPDKDEESFQEALDDVPFEQGHRRRDGAGGRARSGKTTREGGAKPVAAAGLSNNRQYRTSG